MIEPPPFFSMPGRKARVTRYIDFTLRLKLKSQSFGVQSRMVPWCTKPAQLNSTSIGADLGGELVDRLLVGGIQHAGPDAACLSSSARVFALMSLAQTWAPSRAKASAAAAADALAGGGDESGFPCEATP